MYSTPEFRDIDGTILQYGDVVVITVVGLPIGKLVKGEVVDIGVVALDNSFAAVGVFALQALGMT